MARDKLKDSKKGTSKESAVFVHAKETRGTRFDIAIFTIAYCRCRSFPGFHIMAAGTPK